MSLLMSAINVCRRFIDEIVAAVEIVSGRRLTGLPEALSDSKIDNF
ncbi:hypothetical protein [Cupriavidus sp. UME77]|nr:hypothetical protein [Cupriavidus sp. UME77]